MTYANRPDIIGKKFNNLTAIEFSHKHKATRGFDYFWKVECECGKFFTTRISAVVNGRTKSCGCMNTRRESHNMSRTRFYKIHEAMKQRCTNKNNAKTKLYFGKLCDRWIKFENFRDDMLESYNKHVAEHGEKQTTIDRIDPSLGYFKENCRWATYVIQNNHISDNKVYDFFGEKLNVTQISKKVGINYSTIIVRMQRNNWNIYQATAKKPNYTKRK